LPWSRTNAVTDSGSTSTYSDTPPRPRFCRVRQRLAARVHDGLEPGVQRRVADDHRFDANAMGELDALGQLVHGGAQQVSARLALRPVQPRPQLTLLHARQRRHPRGVLRALDERERLQHRVVQVRRDVLPLLRTDAFPALLAHLGASRMIHGPTMSASRTA
jgi:hypothetical protein